MNSRMIEYIVMLAVSFNGILAFLNTSLLTIKTSHVIICEVLLITISMVVIVGNFKKSMWPWIAFIAFFMGLNLFLSIFTGYINAKAVRDMLIIANFGLLGLCYRGSLMPFMNVLVVLVMGLAFLEVFATDIFVSIFNPMKYYFSTRGIGDADDALGVAGGVFHNALSFDGRMTFALFDTHRISSIFLEQTSLGMFNVFLTAFTSSFWRYLSKMQKIFFPICIFLMIGFADSRFAVGMIFAVLLVHIMTIYVPRYTNLLYMPVFVLLIVILFYDPLYYKLFSDTISGRLRYALYAIGNISFEGLMGVGLDNAPNLWDNGYGYVIYNHSIFGLLVYWIFTSLIIPQNHMVAKKFAHNLSVVIWVSLVSGGIIFSIKTACLFWFIAGILTHQATTLSQQKQ